MRKAKEDERVVCQECQQSFAGMKVWDSELPNGRAIAYGVVPNHTEPIVAMYGIGGMMPPCDGSGMAVPVTKPVTKP